MKSYDSRTYSINDFVEWDKREGQLEINPRFQRRSVWTDKAKSYLMDTIIRGKPIPKFFIRQKINVTTKTSTRDVVDGQQRLRTILSYIKDGFVIYKRHHKEYGGLRFSQLPEEIQENILGYEVAVDLLINMPDSEVLDIFSRLNSYAVILNEQEKINAEHFSEFKVLADKIGHKYYDYWTNQGILTAKNIIRMQEVNLVADLLIAMIEGIKSKKQIGKYYDIYEAKFEHDVDQLEEKFDATIRKIGELYPEGLHETEFRRLHIFYSLFTTVGHCIYGLPHLPPHPNPLNKQQIQAARNGLDQIEEIFENDDINKLNPGAQQFLQDARRATTDEAVRERRTLYLLELVG
jgi:hypothetical protein